MHRFLRPIVFASALALVFSATVFDDAGARGKGRAARARSGSTHQQATRTGPDGQSRSWQRDSSWQQSELTRK